MANTGYPQLQPEAILTDGTTEDTALRSVGGIEYPRDNVFKYAQVKCVQSPDLTIPRVDTLATATAIGNSTTANTDQSDTTLITPAFTVQLTSYISDVIISQYAKKLLSGEVNQLRYELQFKRIAIIKQVLNDLYRPQAGASILGLPDLITQIFGAVGVLNLDFLDDAVSAVKGADDENTEKLIVMHPNTLKAIYRTVRGQGWSMQYVMVNGNRYPMWNGVPMMVSDYIPLDEGVGNDETSIWVLANGYESNGFFFICPSLVGDNGWVCEKIALGSNVDTCNYRVKWFVQTVLTSATGGARYQGIQLP